MSLPSSANPDQPRDRRQRLAGELAYVRSRAHLLTAAELASLTDTVHAQIAAVDAEIGPQDGTR